MPPGDTPAGHRCLQRFIAVLILATQDDTRWRRLIWQAGARANLHEQPALAQVELAMP